MRFLFFRIVFLCLIMIKFNKYELGGILKMNIVKMRIHHFFDIVRAMGCGCVFDPKNYGHKMGDLAKRLCHEYDSLKIEIVKECDDICPGCIFFRGGHCIDKIDHRKDFDSKEKFNDHVDNKIIKTLSLKVGEIYSIDLLLGMTDKYVEEIDMIYAGNDDWHNEERKEKVKRGAEVIKIIK